MAVVCLSWKHCAIQAGHGLHLVPRSTQPSTLCGMVKWLSNGNGRVDDSSLLVDLYTKSADLDWVLSATYHCSTFIKWTAWTFCCCCCCCWLLLLAATVVLLQYFQFLWYRCLLPKIKLTRRWSNLRHWQFPRIYWATRSTGRHHHHLLNRHPESLWSHKVLRTASNRRASRQLSSRYSRQWTKWNSCCWTSSRRSSRRLQCERCDSSTPAGSATHFLQSARNLLSFFLLSVQRQWTAWSIITYYVWSVMLNSTYSCCHSLTYVLFCQK